MVRVAKVVRLAAWLGGALALGGACGGRQVTSGAGDDEVGAGRGGAPISGGSRPTAGTQASAGMAVDPGGAGGTPLGGMHAAGTSGQGGGGTGGASVVQPLPSCNPEAPLCPAGTACRINLIGSFQCAKCGGTNEPCCDDQACNAGGCCVQDRCAADNSTLQADPAEPSRCVASGETCSNGATCENQACGDCGGPEQPCCSPTGSTLTFCSSPFTECYAQQDKPACHECGGLGQPKCDRDRPCKTGAPDPVSGSCK